MAYYRVCSCCGANLDPGEPCDCQNEKEQQQKEREQSQKKLVSATITEKNGQLKLAI